MLVLDDVFAELDTRRRERLAELVAPGEQVLVTAAVDDDVPGVLAGARFAVSGGHGGARMSENAPEPKPEPPKPPEPSGVDLARVALRAAKEQARARGDAARQKKQARRGGLRSGAHADGRDPMALGSAINRLITERGWETPAAVGGVMGRWPQIVGDELAKHCVPEKYDEDERVLIVRCDSTAWATSCGCWLRSWSRG